MMAVCREANGQTRLITLPAGSVLVVERVTLQSGLLDARWEDQTVSVFAQDLKARAGLVRKAVGVKLG
jgi:hypothetical protein